MRKFVLPQTPVDYDMEKRNSTMHLTLALALMAGIPGDANLNLSKFDSYRDGYYSAQKTKQPLLLIINPGSGSEEKPIALEDIAKTQARRELLKNYVVVMVDASTEQGKVVHRQFDNLPLPRVVVIDRDQEWQIYRTSEQMYGELWTRVLETFKEGDADARLEDSSVCTTCNQQ